MSSSLQTNLVALQTSRLIGQAARTASKTMYSVSSGLRVARAQDDAASIAISTTLRGQIQGMGACLINIQSADAALQTAESAMGQISEVIIRMRELATQALSEQLSSQNLSDLNTEYQALRSEINRIASSTSYNGNPLMDGSFNKRIQISTGTADDIDNIQVQIATSVDIVDSTSTISSRADAVLAVGQINTAEIAINTIRSQVGAAQSRFGFALNVASVTKENLIQANSAIVDLNVSDGMANLAVQLIRQSAGYQMLNRANQTPQDILVILRG
jgi:flagellin